MGYVATKQELIAILRRFDMDGDAKISFKEFELGMRSSMSNFTAKGKRPNSTIGYKKKRSMSRDINMATPRKNSINRSNSSSELKVMKNRRISDSASTCRRKAI
jgi:hypothetical protein